MVKVVLLIGRANSGKTNTLKKFFGADRRLKPYEYIEIGDKETICAVGLGSPQELRPPFCNYGPVIANINKRLNIAKKAVKERHAKNDFIFIIPFGLYMKKGKPNEDCILKPIKQLKDDGYEVLPIYLQMPFKKSLSKNPVFDNFMKGVTTRIVSSRGAYNEQADELKKIISP